MGAFQVDRIASQLIILCTLCWPATAAPTAPQKTTKQWTFDEIPPSRSLTWYPCLSNYICAMLDVPLDYSSPNGPRAAVPLIKIAAQDNSPNGTYKGMILTNPGGPGLPGVDFLLESGFSSLVPVIGTNFDIVSFDPRGLGRSIPSGNCSSSSTELRRRAFGLDGPELTLPFWTQQLESAQQLGAQCEAAIGGPDDAGRHMSTVVVARDMLSIVDAFAATESGKTTEDSSLLNYWGISYGTFIGETFASMYPDRVGRVTLDGVVDPRDYISGRDLSDISNVDAVVNSFFVYCHFAGPKLCPFYTGTTISDISQRFEKLFVPLNASEAEARNWANASVILESLALIKQNLRATVYSPISSFPPMAQQLVAYESVLHNLTVAGIEAASSLGLVNTVIPGTIAGRSEWETGVLCGEIPSVYKQNYANQSSYLRELERQSFVSGEMWGVNAIQCTGWPIRAEWTFTGPFRGKTKNPILFVSNTLDPATPIINSQTWSPLFKGSGILTIDGTGHTSMSLNNGCANVKSDITSKKADCPVKTRFVQWNKDLLVLL